MAPSSASCSTSTPTTRSAPSIATGSPATTSCSLRMVRAAAATTRRFLPHRDPARGSPVRRRPRRHVCVAIESVQSRQQQRERMLGNGLGVHALATGPDAVVMDHVDVRLDPGPRQLHPLHSAGCAVIARRARPLSLARPTRGLRRLSMPRSCRRRTRSRRPASRVPLWERALTCGELMARTLVSHCYVGTPMVRHHCKGAGRSRRLQQLAHRHLWLHFSRLGAFAEREHPDVRARRGCPPDTKTARATSTHCPACCASRSRRASWPPPPPCKPRGWRTAPRPTRRRSSWRPASPAMCPAT